MLMMEELKNYLNIDIAGISIAFLTLIVGVLALLKSSNKKEVKADNGGVAFGGNADINNSLNTTNNIIVNSSSDKKKQDLAHDKSVYRSLNLEFKEDVLKSHVDSILTSHSYRSDEDSAFLYFYHNGNKVEHNFITPAINHKKDALFDSLRKFTQFKYANFDPNREGCSRRYLFPRGNVDLRPHVSEENDKKYDVLASELNILGDQLMLDCDNYRMAIKCELGI